MSPAAAALDPAVRQALANLRLLVFDFDGVFTDNMVYVSEDGTESVRCCRSDGLGLARLRPLGVALAVLSTEVNPVVSRRCAKLRLDCRQGCEDKAAELARLAAGLAVPLSATAFLGNDSNDLPAMTLVGLPVAVADAWPAARAAARLVTSRPGGHGAVRELCDLICECREAQA